MDESTVRAWLGKLGEELDRRCPVVDRLDRYRAGYPDVPDAIHEIRAEPEYRVLLRQSVTNWPELIIDSRLDRLEVTGFDLGVDLADDLAWSIWQRNALDANSSLVHEAALTDGRAFAIIWPDANGEAEIVPEHADTCVVAYSVVNPRIRVAAMRRWEEDARWYATVYTPDEVWKFQGKAMEGKPTTSAEWEPREGTEPVIPNPIGTVPVVEFAVGRTLSRYRRSADPLYGPLKVDRQFGSGTGEFEGVLPIIDRINTVMFNGLLACAFAGFPVRALIGDPIIWQTEADGTPSVDESGNPIPQATFKPAINRFFQIENPDGKLMQLPAADLTQFIQFTDAQIRYLAAITKTPAHYLLGEMVNLSADAIRAAEAALISRVKGRLWLELGEPWEETIRIATMIETNGNVVAPPSSQTLWRDAENRSQAEQADAAVKLNGILPWQALAERILNATPQEVAKWETMRTSEGLMGTLVAASTEVMTPPGTPPQFGTPPPAPSTNGG